MGIWAETYANLSGENRGFTVGHEWTGYEPNRGTHSAADCMMAWGYTDMSWTNNPLLHLSTLQRARKQSVAFSHLSSSHHHSFLRWGCLGKRQS